MQNAYQNNNRKVSSFSGITPEEYQLLHSNPFHDTSNEKRMTSSRPVSRTVSNNIHKSNGRFNNKYKHENDQTININIKKKIRWKFRPKSFWPFLIWGMIIFIFCKILIFPLTEGLYNYFTKNNEIKVLQERYHSLKRQIETMNQTRDYMLTSEYVAERGHQIGMVRPNETQMLVIDSQMTDAVQNIRIIPKRKNRSIEIGD